MREWVIHHSVRDLAVPFSICPLRGFLKVCETPWAFSCGGNAAWGTPFRLLARNRGFETVYVEILRQKMSRSRGEKKPLAIVSHCHWFEHFSRTGLVKGLCWWIGSQQWGAGKVLVLCNCPSRGVAQLLHASARSFVVLVLMKTQEGTSF